jgi:hypothetical protein
MSEIKREEILIANIANDGNVLLHNERLFAVIFLRKNERGVHLGLRIPADVPDTFCSLDAEARALGLAQLEKLFESLKQELTGVRQ